MDPISVLVVDDSPSVRAVLRRFLSRAADLRVVGEAADGVAAVEAVERLRPDVMLLDLVMPRLDGFGVLERLGSAGVPTVILTSRASRAEVRSAFEALRIGAVELLPKPEDPDSWRNLSETLPQVLRAAAAAGAAARSIAAADGAARSTTSAPGEAGGAGTSILAAAPALRPAGLQPAAAPLRWLAIGASTGGPAALRDLLAALPAPPPVRVLVVQHIARGFEPGLADWLSGSLGLDVRVALDGERVRPGTVRVAPAGSHLKVATDGRLALDEATPPRRGHRPAVDELFLSLAAHEPAATAAALLTGMGVDGAEGLLALRRAGALCLAQDEASSAVFGMPRAAIEMGAAERALPPRALGEELARHLRERE